MPKRNLVWIVAIIAAAVVTVWVTRSGPRVSDPDQEQFRSVVWTYRKIKDSYYRRTRLDELRRGAVRGMVEALDEFSTYIPPDEVESFRSRMQGDQQGLGLHVEVVDGQAKVIGALFDSPAHRASLAADDRILAIDGKTVTGLTVRQLRQKLCGEIGTKVILTVLRAAGGAEQPVELTRSEFLLETVQGLCRDAAGSWDWLADDEAGIAYVRIKELATHTCDQFKQAFPQGASPRKLVLDLRDNPGGLLESVVAVADLFLRQGVIVETLSRKGRKRTYQAHADGTFRSDIPIVVLVNGRTASAGEILAGAIRCHHRAVLVGTRTRGKGCVQSMIPLPGDLGQINLTTKFFLLGSGRPISRLPGSDVWGVEPHVEVTLSARQQERLRRLWKRAEVMPPRRPTTLPEGRSGSFSRQLKQALLEHDDQLAWAISILNNPAQMRRILEKARAEARAAKHVEPEDE